MSLFLSPAYASAYPEDAAQADAADDFEAQASREPLPAHHDRLDELLAAAGKQLHPPALSFANSQLRALGAANSRMAQVLQRRPLTDAEFDKLIEHADDALREKREEWLRDNWSPNDDEARIDWSRE